MNVNTFTDGEMAILVGIAREAVRSHLENRAPSYPDAGRFAGIRAGAFVSLHIGSALRGCIGRMGADTELAETIASMACAAAFGDPRFPPVSDDELPTVSFEVSVLSPLEPCAASEIIPGTHGVWLERRGRQAVFLPQVASEQGWDRDTLLSMLCRKAGLAGDEWRADDATLKRFTARVYGEAAERPD